MLGRVSDKKLAARLNRTVIAVILRRIKRGIAPFGSKRRLWTREEDGQIGDRHVRTRKSPRIKRSKH